MSAPTVPTVSVVMPTFNRRDLLPRVLEPLLADPDALEIVVVVDGSQDGSLELLERMAEREPRLRPIRIENAGIGGARTAGARAAQGDILLLLDDDVRSAPGIVGGHARAHAGTEHLVVVGAMPVAGGPQRDARDYPRAMYAAEYLRHCQRWVDRPETVLDTFWAGHMSLPRADLLALDPPDPSELARGYHEDIDFGLRCRRAGLRGVYDPELRAEHFYTRTPEQFVRDAASSGRGLLLLHRAHPDELGHFRDEKLLGDLPSPFQALVRQAVEHDWIVRLFAATVLVLGGLRLFRQQRRAAFLRWVTEQLREIHRLSGVPEPQPALR